MWFGLTREVVLYYDHLITIDDEYRHIWCHRKTGSSYLFLVNRYFSFFAVSHTLLILLSAWGTHARKTQNIAISIGHFFYIFPTVEASVRSIFACTSLTEHALDQRSVSNATDGHQQSSLLYQLFPLYPIPADHAPDSPNYCWWYVPSSRSRAIRQAICDNENMSSQPLLEDVRPSQV